MQMAFPITLQLWFYQDGVSQGRAFVLPANQTYFPVRSWDTLLPVPLATDTHLQAMGFFTPGYTYTVDFACRAPKSVQRQADPVRENESWR